MKRLVVHVDRCTGCKTCELACALSHGSGMKLARSRINHVSFSDERHITMLCLQCDEAACRKVCPSGALERNETTGAIEIDLERCVQCRSCVAVCPFGNIFIDPGSRGIVKCDLCGGEPVCASFCPTRTLEYR